MTVLALRAVSACRGWAGAAQHSGGDRQRGLRLALRGRVHAAGDTEPSDHARHPPPQRRHVVRKTRPGRACIPGARCSVIVYIFLDTVRLLCPVCYSMHLHTAQYGNSSCSSFMISAKCGPALPASPVHSERSQAAHA